MAAYQCLDEDILHVHFGLQKLTGPLLSLSTDRGRVGQTPSITTVRGF